MSELAIHPSVVSLAIRFPDGGEYVLFISREAWQFDRARTLGLIERVVGEASDLAANDAAAPPFYAGGPKMTPVQD